MRSNEKEHLNYYFSIFLFSVDVWPLTFLFIVFLPAAMQLWARTARHLDYSPSQCIVGVAGVGSLQEFWLEVRLLE